MNIDDQLGASFVSPRGSKISASELLQEVDEYFEVGALVKPGDTVLDVGANAGVFSLRIAEKTLGDVSLFCFEPSPITYRALAANFQAIPILSGTRHQTFHVGLASRDEAGREISFFNFRRYPTNSTFDLAGKRREFEIFFEVRGRRARSQLERALPGIGRAIGAAVERFVSAIPKGELAWWVTRQVMGLEEMKARLAALDDVIREQGIERVDLLKVDVEGPELEVLKGLGPDSWPRIRQVVMETHNRDGRQAEIEGLLRANGLTRIRTMLQRTIDNGLESVMLHAKRPDASRSAT